MGAGMNMSCRALKNLRQEHLFSVPAEGKGVSAQTSGRSVPAGQDWFEAQAIRQCRVRYSVLTREPQAVIQTPVSR